MIKNLESTVDELYKIQHANFYKQCWPKITDWTKPLFHTVE